MTIQANLGFVDSDEVSSFSGWARSGSGVAKVVIRIGDQELAMVIRPEFERQDVVAVHGGDAHCGFCVDLRPLLRPEHHRKLLCAFFAGTNDPVPNGARVVLLDPPRLGRDFSVLDESQSKLRAKLRWRADEPAQGLTWGVMMSGATFWDAVLPRVEITPATSLLEIGPGYGRMLKELCARRVRFASYVGVELSAARVAKLREQFQECAFDAADFETYDHEPVDVVFSSSTFEHFFPDCQRALANVRRIARGAAVMDFLGRGKTTFEDDGTFVRYYPDDELADLFRKAGFRNVEFTRLQFGKSHLGTDVERTLVIAS